MRLVSLLVLATLILTGCADLPTSRIETLRPDGLRHLLRWATHDGPLPVEVLNQPFGAAQAEEAAAVVAEGVKQGVTGRTIDTSTRAEDRAEATYTLRVVLDAPAGANSETLCGTEPEATTPPDSDPLRVIMLFCSHRGDEAWMEGAVRGQMARPTTPADPAFQGLIRQMSRQMFTPRRDPNAGRRLRAEL